MRCHTCHIGVQCVRIWFLPFYTNGLRTASRQVALCSTFPATVQTWAMWLSTSTIVTVWGQNWVKIVSSIMWGHVFIVSIMTMTHWTILAFIICPHCLFMDIECLGLAHSCLLFPTSNYIVYYIFHSISLFLILQLSTAWCINTCLIKHSLSLPEFLIYIRDPIFITGWILRNSYLSIAFIWFLSVWDWMWRQFWGSIVSIPIIGYLYLYYWC